MNPSEWDVYSQIKPFYSKAWSCDISVDKLMYDIDGVVTNDIKKTAKIVFTILVLKSISIASTS